MSREPLPMATPRKSRRKTYRRIYLREWLDIRHKKQRDVAEATGISEPQLSLMIRGKRQYTQEKLEILAEFLNVHPADLLYPPDQSPLGRLIIDLPPEDRDRIAKIIAALRA